MTISQELIVSEEAKKFIKNLRNNAEEYNEREMLDYILRILTGYEMFKRNCTQWEYRYDNSLSGKVELKYKGISFEIMQRLILYSWSEVVHIY